MSASRFYTVITFAGLLLLSGCALQQDVNRLENHIVALSRQNERDAKKVADLERQIQELQRRNQQIAALQGESTQITTQLQELRKNQDDRERELREQMASLRVGNSKLREDFQDLLGRAEMVDHTAKQKTKATEDSLRQWESRIQQLESLVEAQRERIGRFEAYLNLEDSAKKPSPKAAASHPEQPLSEDELYTAAKKAFDGNEFEKAREGFQKLIETYPKSQNADNAQFWIGEIYYREKWYEKSILEYQKVIEKYPKGNKVPAAMLKQGLAFLNIGDKANARLILQELVKNFPKSNEATIAKQNLKGL